MARMHALGALTGRRRRRVGLRALVQVIMFGPVLLGLAACTLIGNRMTTATALKINAPVPSGSGLYSLRYDLENGVSHYTVVRDDAATGTPQWQQTVPGGVTKLTVSDGTIYVNTGLNALALRGGDGTELWNTSLSDSLQPQFNDNAQMRQQPVVADGHVYLAETPVRFMQGQVEALRASDGEHLWSHTFDDILDVTAGDGLVFVTSGGNGISALHAADGSLAWQAQYTGPVQLLGGLVYVNLAPAPLVALDEHTGALVWTLPCWQQSAIVPSALGTRIYIGCLEPHNSVVTFAGIFAFDTQQHQVLWKYQASNFGTPVAVANLVVIPNGTALDAVGASDGKLVWHQQSEEPNAGPVALARIGDTLYVRVRLIYPHVYIFGCGTNCKQSYSLSALRASDGVAYWRHYEPSGNLQLIAA
ncbi:MAG: PQQ-binding-like beta-propeller repeat protein [Ktedonobacterales bacterium]